MTGQATVQGSSSRAAAKRLERVTAVLLGFGSLLVTPLFMLGVENMV